MIVYAQHCYCTLLTPYQLIKLQKAMMVWGLSEKEEFADIH